MCWKPCLSCWSPHLLREEFLSAPIHPPSLVRRIGPSPRQNQQPFRGRKKEPTQNVMVAVEFDLKLSYVLADWEGSAHDATVLAGAIETNDGFTIPQGNCTNKLLLI
jgi:hypothetical protein